MRCRPTPHPTPPRPGDVRGPHAALAVVHAVLSRPPAIVAMLLDRPSGDGAVLVVEGAVDAELEEELRVFLDCAADSSFTEMVLATTRPGPLGAASLADVERWFSLDAEAASAGVRLLDWLVLGRHRVRSMAQCAFSDDRW